MGKSKQSSKVCDEIRRLGGIGMPIQKISLLIRVDEREIEENEDYFRAFQESRAMLEATIRESQIRTAIDDKCSTMKVWLGKQYCGQKDKIDQEIKQMVTTDMIIQQDEDGGDE